MELTVGAIQMESANQDIDGNLDRALPLVEQAARKGATLICLPEFLPSGYIFDETAWDAAEPRGGTTVQWLAHHAKRLNVTLGTSFLEADNDRFKNAFVLMGPEGEYGRVYKQDVAVFENFFMAGQSGSHVIETPFAKIGVGICYENLRAFLSKLLVKHDVDLVLQPHSCPALPGFLPRWARRIFDQEIGGTAEKYAKGLGIPAVFVNKCGPFDSPLPLFPFNRLRVPFAGFTTIADSDGTVLQKAKKEQAVLVDTVHLEPKRKTRRPLPSKGKWACSFPWIALKYMEYVDRRGKSSYRKNPRGARVAKTKSDS